MTREQKFFNALRDVFVGAKVEGESGYINLMRIKSRYYEKGVFPRLQQDINEALKPFPAFRDELFEKLHDFFHRYFSESGSIYFRYTPLHQNVYEKVYTDDKDVMLFWKTHMLYYVKTDHLFRSLDVELDGQKFFFDASTLEHKKADAFAVDYLGSPERKVNSDWTDIESYSKNWSFFTENSEQLFQRVVGAGSGKAGVVMDYFLGSGTTVAVAHKLGRKWIGVEMGEHCSNVYEESGQTKTGILGRMKEVLAGRANHEPSGITEHVSWEGGGFFKYYELEQYDAGLRRAKPATPTCSTIRTRPPTTNTFSCAT